MFNKFAKFLFGFLLLLSTLASLGQDLQSQPIESSGDSGEFSLFEKTISLSAETNFKRVTGLLGSLIGHYSNGNDEMVLKQIQQEVTKELNDLSLEPGSTILLPLFTEKLNIRESETKDVKNTYIFGESITHVYKKFVADYVIRVNVLLAKNITQLNGYEYLGQVTPTLIMGYFENFQSYRKYEQLARLDRLDSNVISLDAFGRSEANEEVRRISLADVQKENRYQLGSLLSKTFPTSKELGEALVYNERQLQITLAFQDSRGSLFGASIVERADTLEEKKRVLSEVGAWGLKRYFDFSYLKYRRSCSRFVSQAE